MPINSKTIQYPYEKIDLRKKVEYDGTKVKYLGYATPGSATSAAVWQIQLYTYDGDNLTDVTFAGGDNLYNQVWDNRASLDYS